MPVEGALGEGAPSFYKYGMRRYISIILEASQPDYHYIGNCTMRENAPYLEDMYEDGTEISFTELVQALGKDLLAETFPQFDWSDHPTDLTMENDYAVSYYRSTFNGHPCYYVQESGIESIFVGVDVETPHAPPKRYGEHIAILDNGEIVAPFTPKAVFHARLAGDTAEVSQSSGASDTAIGALQNWLFKHGVKTIDENDEEMSIEEFFNNF